MKTPLVDSLFACPQSVPVSITPVSQSSPRHKLAFPNVTLRPAYFGHQVTKTVPTMTSFQPGSRARKTKSLPGYNGGGEIRRNYNLRAGTLHVSALA